MLKTSPKGLGLLGSLNQVSKPLRISDIASHPSSVGFPENHPTMKPFLGIPVWYHGEHVGSIYLTEKERAQEFTEEDEEILVMFASQAASIISNARRYEEEHQAKVYLETLLDLSPMGVVVFNTQTGDLDFLNQEVRRMMGDLGIPEEGLDDIFEVLSFRRTDGREISYMDLPAMRVLLSAETVRAEEIVVQAPSGKEITAVINAAPIFSESGEIVSVVSVLQDMTPLDNLERKRAEFLGVVSEELRTPLTTIKGSAAALRSIVESMNPTEPLQLLRIIDQQADLMRSQVNSLIEVSQIETGTLSVVAELADVSELLKEACGEFIRDHGASAIEPDIPAGLPNVMVDKQRIGQVLHNFLRQAAKYSNESAPIKVSASTVDIYVAISVSVEASFASPQETSVPSDESETPEVFKKIVRSHAKIEGMVSQGEGLAIAFCRGVVETHGGRMHVEDGAGPGGMTIAFTIPSVDEPEEEAVSVSTPHARHDGSPASEAARRLVYIDDPQVQGTVRQVLSSAGYTPITAYDLDSLENLIKKETPHLLLMDLSSHGAEGFELTRHLSNAFDVPVIVLSSQGDDEDITRAFEMGAADYMVRPFSPTELVARIKASLRRRAREGGPAPTELGHSKAIRWATWQSTTRDVW